MIGQPREDVGEPGLRVDAVELGGLDQRVDPGATLRGGPEALPPQPGDLQLQLLDRNLRGEPGRPLGQVHGMGGGEIRGKRRGLGRVRHTEEMSIFFKRRNALSSAESARTPALLRHAPVDAREQVAKLRRRDRNRPVRNGRLQEAAAVEPLGVEAAPPGRRSYRSGSGSNCGRAVC